MVSVGAWWSEGCNFCHAAINSIIQHSLKSVRVPSQLEPSCKLSSDGWCPDGIPIVPWCGKCLITCPDMHTLFYRTVGAQRVGEVAMQVEQLKHSKYPNLESKCDFLPVAVETSVAFGPEAC